MKPTLRPPATVCRLNNHLHASINKYKNKRYAKVRKLYALIVRESWNPVCTHIHVIICLFFNSSFIFVASVNNCTVAKKSKFHFNTQIQVVTKPMYISVFASSHYHSSWNTGSVYIKRLVKKNCNCIFFMIK